VRSSSSSPARWCSALVGAEQRLRRLADAVVREAEAARRRRDQAFLAELEERSRERSGRLAREVREQLDVELVARAAGELDHGEGPRRERLELADHQRDRVVGDVGGRHVPIVPGPAVRMREVDQAACVEVHHELLDQERAAAGLARDARDQRPRLLGWATERIGEHLRRRLEVERREAELHEGDVLALEIREQPGERMRGVDLAGAIRTDREQRARLTRRE
jgi:hypothetical protein